MHHASVTPAAHAARQGGAAALAQALSDSRRDTLATFALYERNLPGLSVPLRAELNPPLWELGHIGWFQTRWLVRNPERARGPAADARLEHEAADLLYDSSRVPHDARWALPLPDAEATRAELAQQLDRTLALLRETPAGDAALYFFRLALLHEDMHHEAALYSARTLGIAIDDARWQAAALPEPQSALAIGAGSWMLGSAQEPGFSFDNELRAHRVELGATLMDAQVVRWDQFLPFVESGGYRDERWWSVAGRRWCAGQPQRTDRWQALNGAQAACHLNFHEAQAWCNWARRRLPTEAEWERAAINHPQAFRWGEVWEWTSSLFAPYPGFEAHPYREYSQPWFDGRPVLRGGSYLTQPRMKHSRYRNFFPAERNDIATGFRSCAI